MSCGLGPGFHAPSGKSVDSLAYERWTGRWSRMFVPMVIAAAQVASGDLVLDVSTGTGEAALVALQAIGASGLVIGVDIAPAMDRSIILAGRRGWAGIALQGRELRRRGVPTGPTILPGSRARTDRVQTCPPLRRQRGGMRHLDV